MAGTALRVVDPAGRDLGPGEPGELLVRGPQVMAGYLGRPDATAAAFAGGWLRTGDLGHVRGDGTVVLEGRLKELIKVDALQVAPAELEALLLSHRAWPTPPWSAGPTSATARSRWPWSCRTARSTPTRWPAGSPRGSRRTSACARCGPSSAIPRTPSGKILRRAAARPLTARPGRPGGPARSAHGPAG